MIEKIEDYLSKVWGIEKYDDETAEWIKHISCDRISCDTN